MRAAMESRFYLSSDSIDSRSPWTGERSPSDPFVQLFTADVTPPAALSPSRTRADEVSWRDWQGFMTRLRGTSGLLRIVDYYRMRPAYDLRNAPAGANWAGGGTWSDGSQWSDAALPPYATLDEAAHADDDSIVLRGLPASTDQVLSPADLIEGRPNGIPTNFGNLYEVVHCSRSNADGKARVYIQPGLRQDFAAGDMMVLREPTCVFRLADKSQGIVTRTHGGIGNLGFKLIEHVRNA
jgi:hypothetical protein